MGRYFAKSHAAIIVCIVGLAVTNSAPALAQPTKMAADQTYGKQGWQDDFIARSIVRTGLLDLRLRSVPAPDDYRLLAQILEIAQTFSPKDPDIVRRTVEAAHNARDLAMLESATRRLVQLDPTDTVAQLRLISSRISKFQTADERLKAYASFLGEKGNSLDGSIRSRLALDAALLSREQGDDAAFVDYLKMALRLDSTNKEAALIAFGHFSEKVNDSAGRVQLLSNLLLADPLDPNIHRQLSQEMAAGGAYLQARRFHDLSSALFTMAGSRPDEHFSVENWISIWAIDGSEQVLAAFEKMLATEKYRANQAAEQAKKELREVTTSADDVRLSPAVERVRLFAADSVQDQKALESVRESLNFADVALSGLVEELKKPQAGTEAEVKEFRRGSAIGLSEIQLLRLWMNIDVDKVAASMAKAVELLDGQESPNVFSAVRAWVLMREGKLEEALAAFELMRYTEFETMADRSVEELDPARVGKAMTLEMMGRGAESAEIYRAVAISRAFDASGLWCKLRLERMGGNDPQREALGKQLAAIGDAVPRLVEDMIKDPSSAFALSADVPVTLSTPLDRSDLIIRLRNKTKIPLGLGTDRTINSRFLVQPSVSIHTDVQTVRVQPEVIDLDRKMRLQPGETLEVRVRADAGYTGWLIESGAGKVVRSRFRIMQGFVPAQDGSMIAGPGCLAADSPQVVRNPLKEALLPIPDMVDRLKLATGDDFITLLMGLKARVLQDGTVGAPERAALAEALAMRYPTLDVKLRIVALLEVPNAAMYEEFRAFDAVAAKETASGAAGLAIVTRISDPNDPALQAAMSSADAPTKEIASIQKARLLELDAFTLSRRGFKSAADQSPGAVSTAPPLPTVPAK